MAGGSMLGRCALDGADGDGHPLGSDHNSDRDDDQDASPVSSGSGTTTDFGNESQLTSPGPGVPDRFLFVQPDGLKAGGLDASLPSGFWSAVPERQSGHGKQQDPSDRIFPIRSVIRVDPAGRASGEYDHVPLRSMSTSESSQISGPRHSPTNSRHELGTPSRRPVGMRSPTSPEFPVSPPGVGNKGGRMPTILPSASGAQAAADRIGPADCIRPLKLAMEESDYDSEVAEDIAGEMSCGSAGRQSPDVGSESLYTHRFKHLLTSEGHAVITGRDGKMQRCEDEPIHTPAAIQAFGLMIVLQEEADGQLQVRYVSENSKRLIGYTPQELFRQVNFLDILSDEQADNLLDHIDFIRDENADPAIDGPEVFSLSVRPPKRRSVKLWCAIHINPAHRHLIICECELDDDHDHPLRPADEERPSVPQDTLRGRPTTEELAESTEILSKPLRVLRSARKRRGEAGAMQVFDIMSQVQDQLASAPNLGRFLKILVGIIKELTGFHRVMIYQFDGNFDGKVVTELVDPVHTSDLYQGLHFPATDIPRQARELYKINKVRLLYDRDLETARIVCRSVEELENALDMSHAYLRAMSPIHLKYLANMSVRSSMSVSINAFGELWGLIACHSYGHKGMRVSFPIRKMCRLIGDNVSRNIERLSYASRLQARKLINTVPTDKNPSGFIIASSEDLLRLFDADFGMLSIRGETKILGRIEHSQEALAMLEYMRLQKFASVLTTQDIRTDFPDLRYPPGFAVIAGLLYVPLSVGGNDFIVFFRKGQVKEVKWAGNPYEKVIQDGTLDFLQPRTSFKAWHETVIGRCREWSEEQVETAAVLCLVYGKFIEVWRQKEAALQSSRLTRLLLANSAHEVRTPLNAIINYLEIALEGSLDNETRENLARSHSASKSLIYVINDLLDLTKTEEGQDLVKDEIFDFRTCIREATEPFKNDARRKGIAYEVFEHDGLPQYVYGDQRRVRQAVSNVTANAVKHTSQGLVRIELYVADVRNKRVRVEIAVQDTGEGMSESQLDALFRDLEQVTTELDDVQATGGSDEQMDQQRTLGLGLAVVARIVRNMDGQLRLKSEAGRGSRFVIQLAFDLPADPSPQTTEQGQERAGTLAASSSIASVSASVTTAPEGEVMLVDRGGGGAGASAATTSTHSSILTPKRSFDETQSLHSQRSRRSQRSVTSRASMASMASGVTGASGMSDADRLIDAIQTPLFVGEPESETTAQQRRCSKGAYYNPPDRKSASAQPARPPATRSISPPAHRKPLSDRNPDRSRPLSAGAHVLDAQRPDERTNDPMGFQFVSDTKTPIRPVKISDQYQSPSQPEARSQTSRVLFEVSDTQAPSPAGRGRAHAAESGPGPTPVKLHVLIAEDDPINLKILRKRLEKAGHSVSHAVNGQDCASVYEDDCQTFDVVLMDMQMPIVDGLTSTRMIRAFERSDKHTGLSRIAAYHGRIPVFAVSASLLERERERYVDAGFDGWILKPIDFRRLETLLRGIFDDEVRNESVYAQGEWERGGWFRRREELPMEEKAVSIQPMSATTTGTNVQTDGNPLEG